MACRLQPVKTCFNYPQKLFFVEPGRNRIISEECWLNKDCVGKKVYHPTFNDNFNSSCPIPVIFGTVITE